MKILHFGLTVWVGTLLLSFGAFADCYPNESMCLKGEGAVCTQSDLGYYYRSSDGYRNGPFGNETACLREHLEELGKACMFRSGYGYCSSKM